jgi:hypothetical protein
MLRQGKQQLDKIERDTHPPPQFTIFHRFIDRTDELGSVQYKPIAAATQKRRLVFRPVA